MNLEVYRKEWKYVLSLTDYYRIEPCLAACLLRDPYDTGEGYEIRSLYFDGYKDNDCRDVLDGLENKQKVRIRIYGPDDLYAKLEYKCKSGSDGLKRSVRISRREALQMTAGNYDSLLEKGETGAELYARMTREVYQPKTMVRYVRRAFLYPANNIRITFDTQIEASADRWSLFEERPCLRMVLPADVGVLEVKYDGFLFSFMKEILESVNALPMANSKYVQARLLY